MRRAPCGRAAETTRNVEDDKRPSATRWPYEAIRASTPNGLETRRIQKSRKQLMWNVPSKIARVQACGMPRRVQRKSELGVEAPSKHTKRACTDVEVLKEATKIYIIQRALCYLNPAGRTSWPAVDRPRGRHPIRSYPPGTHPNAARAEGARPTRRHVDALPWRALGETLDAPRLDRLQLRVGAPAARLGAGAGTVALALRTPELMLSGGDGKVRDNKWG